MKKIGIIAAALSASLLLLAGCSEKEETKTVTVTVTIDESGLAENVVKPESYTVRVTNNASSTNVSVQTQNGVATVEGVLPGIYTVVVNAESVDNSHRFIFSGETSANLVKGSDNEVVVKVSATEASALILKEIYYNGCTIADADPNDPDSYAETYFRDQFYEIYNNSTEVVYADGLCLSDNTGTFANWDWSNIYTYDIANPDDYLFVETVWQVPGNGTDYPIKPGESIIVAQWGTNHTDASLAGDKSIDLSGADFEAITEASTLWNGLVITDNPAINMVKAIQAGYSSPQWLISVYSGDVILFRPSTPLKNEDFLPAKESSNTSAREILRSDVLDAVQWMENEEDFAEPTHHRLPAAIDAGCNFLPAYTGKSISRKVSYTREDGTVVYQDTNNTTEDFVQNDKPEIRRNGAKVPSWNNWAK